VNAPVVEAHRLEEIWVNFKLFGLLGLTILFIIAQAWFLTRYMKDPDQPGTEET
jgi:intracellular septation protein